MNIPLITRITNLTLFLFFSAIANSQIIHFECDFEEEGWYQKWGIEKNPRNALLVEKDETLLFQPLDGKALEIHVEKDGHYGTSIQYDFQKLHGYEPKEIYFRYSIRLANDWNPERGGKLPGIAGTYNKAGWGGRPVHGNDGWSARGLFKGIKNGFTPIGYYAYHMDMKGQYGSNWEWDRNNFEGLENNRWYSIHQQIKLNEPGKANGIARAWVDDVLVFEKTDIRFRSINELKIENVWINVYHGGKWTAKSNHHLYIDNVIISSDKIGKPKINN